MSESLLDRAALALAQSGWGNVVSPVERVKADRIVAARRAVQLIVALTKDEDAPSIELGWMGVPMWQYDAVVQECGRAYDRLGEIYEALGVDNSDETPVNHHKSAMRKIDELKRSPGPRTVVQHELYSNAMNAVCDELEVEFVGPLSDGDVIDRVGELKRELDDVETMLHEIYDMLGIDPDDVRAHSEAMRKIKPVAAKPNECRFCGGAAIIQKERGIDGSVAHPIPGEWWYFLECDSCGARTWMHRTESAAVREWNTGERT